MKFLNETQAELDSTLLANSILEELRIEPEEITEENIVFTRRELRKISQGCLATARETASFSKKMIRMMEMEHFEFEDCAPPLEEGQVVDIDIPIQTLFENLSDYVCVALAS